jgi:integration host factor subunit beta
MTKSELIAMLASKQPLLPHKDVTLAIDAIIQTLTEAVAAGQRIEIRGFGGFSTNLRPARHGRNPKTGEAVPVPVRRSLHFKPGMDMRQRVDESRLKYQVVRDL